MRNVQSISQELLSLAIQKAFGKRNISMVLLGQERNGIFNYWGLSISCPTSGYLGLAR